MIKSYLHKFSRIALYLVSLCLFVMLVIALLLRFLVLPNIDRYKDKIANYVSATAGQKITIGQIQAHWDGINPHLSLRNIDVFDSDHRSALNFKHIDSNISWLSLPLFEARLNKLVIYSPELMIRRDANGKVFVAGIDMSGSSNPAAANWLLKQANVEVLNAKVIWQDDFRKAPPLSLNKLNLHLINPALQRLIGRHEFKLSATPSIGSAAPILISGHYYGRDVSKWTTWHGQIVATVKNTDLSVWKPWIDYPYELQAGFGSAKVMLNFSDAKLEKITSDFALTNVTVKLNATTEAFTFKELSGQFNQQTRANEQEFKAENIKLVADHGLNIKKADARVVSKNIKGRLMFNADLSLDVLELEVLNKIAPYFPLPETLLKPLNNIAPVGTLQNLKLHWVGDQTKPTEYSISSAFNSLSINAYERMPGFTNLAGNITLNEHGGELKLNAKNALLDAKQVLRWPVPIDQLIGQFNWKTNAGITTFTTKNLNIANAHLTGHINATYIANGIKGGNLDLQAKLGNGNIKYAPYYYPTTLGKDTLHWLDTSILSGRADDINVAVKGNLADFPFVDQNHRVDHAQGLFKVTAKISDAKIEYGTGWPQIEGLGLDMLFEGTRMELKANKGHLFGNQIISSHIQIPVLDADYPMLNIVSEVQGSVTEAIKFVNNSPVKEVAQGFTGDLKTLGNGKLHLTLKIPLNEVENSKYKGIYEIINGTIAADATLGLPELSRINGKLNFTESGLQATNINTWTYGGATQISLNTSKDKIIHVTAHGRATDSAIKQMLGMASLTDYINGAADWTGNITIKKPFVDISLRSNLVGMALNLPAPFNKSAAEQSLLRIDKKQLSATTDSLTIGFSNLLNAKILLLKRDDGISIDRGEIGIHTSAELPAQKGLSIRGTLDYLDADAWREVFSSSTNNKASGSASALNINKAEFNIKSLVIFERSLNAVFVSMQPNSDGWKSSLTSKEINGNIQWVNANNGKLIARLKNFSVPNPTDNNATNTSSNANDSNIPTAPKKDFVKLIQHYPALDIIAYNFEVGQKKLGKLELIAVPNNEDWSIQKLKISNEDSTLTADGEWHNWKHNPNTRLNFNWDIAHLDKTLRRFGQPDTIKGGAANLSGQLSWDGSPHQFETDGLNGSFKLKATKGQIVKMQPGVGRLLGLLSLQSLPRRLSLDFRDLFSSGFAYDVISATATVNNGIMRSDDFYMTGPAADVTIKGETNLQKETLNLKIKVVPNVSDSLSLAAFAGGPIVGIAAFLAQKILKDPLNKISSTEYHIVGTWDNPQEVTTEKPNTEKDNISSPKN